MSGPKGLTVVQFDAIVESILAIQDQINSLWQRLNSYSVDDEARQVNLNCNEFLAENSKDFKKLSKALNLPNTNIAARGDFMRKMQNRYKRFVKRVNNEEKSYLEKLNDYQSYLDYEKFFDKTLSQYDNFIQAIKDYYQENIQAAHPKIYQEFTKTLTTLIELPTKEKFSLGFSDERVRLQDNLKAVIVKNEKKVHELRAKFSSAVLDALQSANGADALASSQTGLLQKTAFFPKEERLLNLAHKIDSKLAAMDASPLKTSLLEKFRQMLSSKVFAKDAFYFQEFLEEVTLSERQKTWRKHLKLILANIQEEIVVEQFKPLKKQFVSEILSFVEKINLKKFEVEKITSDANSFLKNVRDEQQKERLKKARENLLKQELLEGLNLLHYEVISDMEVIDFERTDDFVLKAPAENGYINIRFLEDGGFIYNFLIDENKDDLSIDQINQKLAGMEKSCADFKDVLKELKAMGIEVKITHDLKVSEKNLLTAPEHILKKIKKSKRTRKRRATKAKKKFMSLDE